jgi:hypothetical protein
VEVAPYESSASTGIAFCFGEDGACPCGNDTSSGNGGGYLNSTGQSAVLSGVGVPYSEYAVCPSVTPPSSDTVKLTANGLPNVPALFFKGISGFNGGNGILFGDGLRCAGGQIIRVQIKFPSRAPSPSASQLPNSHLTPTHSQEKAISTKFGTEKYFPCADPSSST